MITFFHFHQDMMARKKDWVEPGGSEARERTQAQTMMEHLMLREALTLHEVEAVATICTPPTYIMGEDVARAMHAILTHDSILRYPLAGHTHMGCLNPVSITGPTPSYL